MKDNDASITKFDLSTPILHVMVNKRQTKQVMVKKKSIFSKHWDKTEN